MRRKQRKRPKQAQIKAFKAKERVFYPTVGGGIRVSAIRRLFFITFKRKMKDKIDLRAFKGSSMNRISDERYLRSRNFKNETKLRLRQPLEIRF